MNWFAVARLLKRAWRWLASSRIVQGAAFVAGLIGYHLLAKRQAGRKGAREERERARVEAYEKRAEHSGDINTARRELDERHQERRERESSENPRDRFGRDPWA